MKAHIAAIIPLVLLAHAPDAHAVINCPLLDCGDNSPIIDGLGFHEANEQGYLNAQGLRLGDLVDPATGTRYRVRVIKDQLVGQSKNFPYFNVLVNTMLAGKYIEVFSPRGSYQLRIEQVSRRDYYVIPGKGDDFYTYEFKWNTTSNAHVQTPLCPAYDENDPNVSQEQLESVVFEGNRYDAPGKFLLAPAASDQYWFNVGCYKTALYKLKRTRNAFHAQIPEFSAPFELQQSMLKMYVGDVCGDGNSYTVQGTPLTWRNEFGVGSTATADVPEAMWDEDGALCMANYRLGSAYYNANVHCDDGNPATLNDNPPPCPTGPQTSWWPLFPSGQVYSAIPAGSIFPW